MPEPKIQQMVDYTLTNGLYSLKIPSVHYLYEYHGTQMVIKSPIYPTEVIRVFYDLVKTVGEIRGVYIPVCAFGFTDVYIYLSSFISDYQLIADNTDGVCVHKHRHHSGGIIDEYKAKLNSSEINTVHQKCLIPQYTNVNMNLINSDCTSSSQNSLPLVLDHDMLIVPQNTNTSDESISTTTVVCNNGVPRLL